MNINIPKKFRLVVLRRLLSVAFWALAKTKSRLALPAAWMLHYLLGSGEDLHAPKGVVREAARAIALAVICHARNDLAWRVEEVKGGRYTLHHSTLYEGSGFYGRPTLFYLVGGFSFTYRNGAIRGVDRYDWHPTKEGQYFTSPLGSSKWMLALIKVLGLIFGSEYFVVSGFPSGEAGISNRLWEDLEAVGARPFDTIVELDDISGEVEELLDRLEDEDRSYYRYGVGVAQKEAAEEEFLGTTAEEFLGAREWLSFDPAFLHGE